MFDVDAVPAEVNAVLRADKQLRPLIKRNPGLRLPGAFDEFEIAVRAIVGQQVSVKGATTVMGVIAERYGSSSEFGQVFPDAETLADLDPSSLPMPTKRAEAIRGLANSIALGELRFDADDQSFMETLLAIPGIGPWTAEYISMRARGNPDAFLEGDLVLKKAAAALFGCQHDRQIVERAENWRPWRGYAGMHLWRYAADQAL